MGNYKNSTKTKRQQANQIKARKRTWMDKQKANYRNSTKHKRNA